MLNNTSNAIRAIMESQSSKLYSHNQFRNIWERARNSHDNDDLIKETSEFSYEDAKVVYLYDNLSQVLSQMDRHPDDYELCKKDFIAFLKDTRYVHVLPVGKSPGKYRWYNTTAKGINLRPGTREASSKLPKAITLTGQTSHAIVGGRTGSGKSVFLNNLILNMMIEYSPWELELYLADFKKVEMSRYMNKYKAPHVRACAATSEVDYVLSLIKFIKNRKDERESLFSRLKIRDISEFRVNYPSVIMPRILFLVDEFQQLFLDANNRQKDIIEDLLTDITRKGRSSGVHLLFASQDMSGALTERQRTNFKVHFALACDSSISNQILGNSAASKLPDKGQVICNKDSSLEEDNIIYNVPFASNESESSGKDSYFDSLLREMSDLAKIFNYQYIDSQKFYQEDQQYSMLPSVEDNNTTSLDQLLHNNKLVTKRSHLPNSIFLSLILGRKVVHTNERYDIENILVERGKNRNILAISGNYPDIAYLQKLFAMNVASIEPPVTSIGQFDSYYHKVIDFNPVLTSMYTNDDLETDLGIVNASQISNTLKVQTYSSSSIEYCTHIEDLTDFVYSDYEDKRYCLSILQDKQKCPDVRSYLRVMMEDMFDGPVKNKATIIEQYMNDLFKGLKDDDSNIEEFLDEVKYKEFDAELQLYYRYRVLNIQPNLLFNPTILWFKGIEVVERLPRWFEDFVSNCMDVNMICIFLSSSKVPSEVETSCNYVFVAGNDSKIYDKYYDDNIITNSNNIKIFCNVKNRNEKFAFKKYRYRFRNVIDPRLNIDDILL